MFVKFNIVFPISFIYSMCGVVIRNTFSSNVEISESHFTHLIQYSLHLSGVFIMQTFYYFLLFPRSHQPTLHYVCVCVCIYIYIYIYIYSTVHKIYLVSTFYVLWVFGKHYCFWTLFLQLCLNILVKYLVSVSFYEEMVHLFFTALSMF